MNISNLIKSAFAVLIFTIIYSCNTMESDHYTPEREAAIISDYIKSLVAGGHDVDTTQTGMFYVIRKEGEGEYAQAGDSIGMIYEGFFPESGYVFDSSDFWYENGVWKFIYLSNELIAGFDEAISYLNKGAEGTFLIPSDLAYGSTGNFNRTIPPYSPLVFNIKLVDIYDQNDN